MWNFFGNYWVWSWKTQWASCWQLTREYTESSKQMQQLVPELPQTTLLASSSKRDSASAFALPFCFLCDSVFSNVYGGKTLGRKKPQEPTIFSPRMRPQILSTLEELEPAPFLSHSEPNFQHWIACFHFWGTLASSWGWVTCSGRYLKDLLHGLFACSLLGPVRQEPVPSWGPFPVWPSDAYQELKQDDIWKLKGAK